MLVEGKNTLDGRVVVVTVNDDTSVAVAFPFYRDPTTGEELVVTYSAHTTLQFISDQLDALRAGRVPPFIYQ